VADPNNLTEDELAAVEAKVSEAIKGALLISGADKRCYGKLKDKLANSYLLGSDQYPNTLDKATRILDNYQRTSRPALPYKPSSNNTGMAFLQQGGQGGRGGHGAQGKSGEKVEGDGADTGGNDDVSMVMAHTGTGDGAMRINSKGEPHCFHCGAIYHWAFECPQLSKEQQAQLHMNNRSQEEREQEQAKEGHQLLNVMLAQAGELPDNLAYLDGCSTVMAIKTYKYLRERETVPGGIKINSNTRAVMANKRGKYGGLNVWYIPDGIANKFSMHKLEKMYRITYDSWDGYYEVHMPKGRV
jgi:hypothetical protein